MIKEFTDQLNRTINISFPPKRIISLVPSQTELLYALGLDDEVIGLTKFCIHPENWFREKRRVGGTKQLHLDIIKELQPDLILGNKEENEQAQIEALMQEFPLWMSDINNLKEAVSMIKSVGEITDRKSKAEQLATDIINQFEDWYNNNLFIKTSDKKLKIAYFIWRKPWMVAAGDTFINEMIKAAGYINIFDDQARYPEIDIEQLKAAAPDIIMLSSEPYPFKEKHIEELQKEIPSAKIILVDGEIFSWYGSRLLKAPAYFKALASRLIC